MAFTRAYLISPINLTNSSPPPISFYLPSEHNGYGATHSSSSDTTGYESYLASTTASQSLLAMLDEGLELLKETDQLQ